MEARAPSGVGGDTRWLDPRERAAWMRLLALSTRLPGALDAQLQRDAGLTLFEYSVLAVLSERDDGTMRMSDLAFLAQGSLSRLSHVARKLENRELVRREPCPDDGRYTNAILTAAGRALVVEAAPRHVTAARDLVIDALTPTQLAQLHRIAGAILTRIDPAGPWPPGATPPPAPTRTPAIGR